MTRWIAFGVALCCSAAAYAGPGFDGVGDRGPMPRFERGMDGPSEPMMRDVRAREQAILDMLAENDPATLERLMRLKERDPHAYTAQLVSVARRVERLRQNPEARARFEEVRNLERQVREQVDALAGLSGEQRDAALASITDLVEQLFEAKQAERRMKMSELRTRMEELEQDIADRDTHKAARIQEYVDQLTQARVDL